MSYLLRNKPRFSYWRKILILVALFIFSGLFFFLTRGFLVSVIRPLWQGGNAVTRTLDLVAQHFRTRAFLVQENISLKERLSDLELELLSARLTLSQQESLVSLLGRPREEREIIASVLTRPPQSAYDLFIIDAGVDDGVSLGDKVALLSGPVLGTITEVFSSSAKVKLFTSAGEKTEAVLERGGVPVLLLGRGGGSFRIEIPRETPVEVGDRVISASTDFSLIAVVEAVKIFPTDAFKEIMARSPANIFQIRLVSVYP